MITHFNIPESGCDDPTCPGWHVCGQPYAIERCDQCFQDGRTLLETDAMAEDLAARSLVRFISAGKQDPELTDAAALINSPDAEYLMGALLATDTGPGAIMRAIRAHTTPSKTPAAAPTAPAVARVVTWIPASEACDMELIGDPRAAYEIEAGNRIEAILDRRDGKGYWPWRTRTGEDRATAIHARFARLLQAADRGRA